MLSCGDDCPEEEAQTTTTTTATPPETTTTIPEITTTTVPEPERFVFDIAGVNYDCEVVDDPHTVEPNEHIWKIVEDQGMPDDMPQRWIGTIRLNQLKGTVGENPNLIYPEDEIYTLIDCIKSNELVATE